MCTAILVQFLCTYEGSLLIYADESEATCIDIHKTYIFTYIRTYIRTWTVGHFSLGTRTCMYIATTDAVRTFVTLTSWPSMYVCIYIYIYIYVIFRH